MEKILSIIASLATIISIISAYKTYKYKNEVIGIRSEIMNNKTIISGNVSFGNGRDGLHFENK